MINVKRELSERIRLDIIFSIASKKMVPVHKYSAWYYMGAILLFLLFVQIITGPLLLFYYKPTAEAAYQSIANIMVNVPGGWLIRSVHHWASNLMVVFVFIHFFSTFFLKAYRRPRELTWFSGMAMFLLVLFIAYSGYSLPFDQRSFFAMSVGTDMPKAIPVVGQYVLEFLRGGEIVGPHTLNRFFALHVAVLPLFLLAMLLLHIVLVQLHGMSVPPSVQKKAEQKNRKIIAIPMFPHVLWHDIINCLFLTGLLVTLAVMLPSELGLEIDYLQPAPEGVKPDWFFLWVYQILKWMPTYMFGVEGEVIGITGLAVIAFFVILVPVFDFKPQYNKLNPFITATSVVCLLILLMFTVLGYFS